MTPEKVNKQKQPKKTVQAKNGGGGKRPLSSQIKPSTSNRARQAKVMQRRVGNGRTAQHFANNLIQRKENKMDLPNKLKSGVETLSGYSMDDVKVYYNSSKPAQLQALAFAQGTDIHVGPGQEKHLPHEAWHVVQQKQGLVRPMIQTKMGVINDDKKLEQEADVMGEKALANGRKVEFKSQSEQPLLVKKPSSFQPVYQPKMGFEFESGANKLQNRPSKYHAATTPNGVRVEADTNHNIEFVTNANQSQANILLQVGEAAAVAHNLANAPRQFDGSVNVLAGNGLGANWSNGERVTIGDANFRASVQSSEGILLEQFRNFMTEHLSNAEVLTVSGHSDHLAATQNNLHAKTKGLLDIFFLYLNRARTRHFGSPEGPKAGFRLMHRSNFKAMYDSLPNWQERRKFRRMLIGNNDIGNAPDNGTPISVRMNLSLNDFMFQHGYLAGPDPHTGNQPNENGPTLRQWITSIISGRNDSNAGVHEDRDLLSPPLGWANHVDVANADRYGMGAYGMDPNNNNLTIFEMRGYRNLLQNNNLYGGNWNNVNGRVPRTQWVNFVTPIIVAARGRGDMQA